MMDREVRDRADEVDKLLMGNEKNKQFVAKYYRILTKINKKKVNYCSPNTNPDHNLIDDILQNSLFV